MSVRVPALEAEVARAGLLALVPEGFEEVEHPDGLELVAYVDPANEGRVRAAFGHASGVDVRPGWEERWRTFHRPSRVGPLWVGPPWSTPDPDSVPIVIDPGRAFGTGSHATTRLCLQLLLEREPGSVLDVGCGSGVLGIAAATLGHGPVYALDLDPAAVDAAAANAALNGVLLEVAAGDATSIELPRARLALANLQADLVRQLAPRLQTGWLIASGYLTADPIEPSGWVRSDRRERDGWAADLFVRAG